MPIVLQRIYDHHETSNGYRVLVDRLWPRGMTKEQANIDEWCKELSPTTELRKWFGHEPEKWPDFSRQYLQELDLHKDAARALLKRADKQTLVLLYGAKDAQHNHAIILKEFLESLSL